MLEAKGVTEIPSKVLISKIQTYQKQPGELHQSKCFNRDLKVPKTYSGAERLQVFLTNSWRNHWWVGDQLTRRGAGCQWECASCFRRARASQRFKLVNATGEAACNLCEPLFNSNWNGLSQEPGVGICAGKPPHAVPKGAQPAVGVSAPSKMLFQNNNGMDENQLIGTWETVDLLDPAALGATCALQR